MVAEFRRLDGIPLAIELAAARVKVLAPHRIAQRLDHGFGCSQAKGARAMPRHQTMTALMVWSYDLLTTARAEISSTLSVFAGVVRSRRRRQSSQPKEKTTST